MLPEPQSDPPASSGSSASQNSLEEIFSRILAALDQEQLPQFATAVLQRTKPLVTVEDSKATIGEPMHGSYNILFPIIFSSGLRWLIKIPVNGIAAQWDDLSASALASEANTMRLLRRETTIPVPDVVDFCPTTNNPLNCPYIIMTYISGIPLPEVWFGSRLRGVSDEIVNRYRTRTLRGIASAMVQLDRFRFRKSGSPRFGTHGELLGYQSSRIVDRIAEVDRMVAGVNTDFDPIYVECPSTKEPKEYYKFLLDKNPRGEEERTKGLELLLRQLIDWIPEPDQTPFPFVLRHPDFGIQNFLVSEEGDLKGIIDWDGVAAVPLTIGNCSYPGWLTLDWVPSAGKYDPEDPKCQFMDPPAVLVDYRKVYHNLITQYREKDADSGKFCRFSLITDRLFLAASSPFDQSSVVYKIVDEIIEIEEEEDLFPIDFNEWFGSGEIKEKGDMLEILHRGFMALLSKEGL